MLNDVYQEAQVRMKKCIDSLHHELAKIRTGRAHPSLLDTISVPYYGSDTPLAQVASVTVGDPRTLVVTPWEKSMVAAIEKAIVSSDLGLNPATVGTIIRVPLPALTEERRKELSRLVKVSGENAKVAIRNVRRDANSQVKDLLKEKAISEDEERKAEEQIQKHTDAFIKEVDEHLDVKEKDIMEI